MFQEYSVVSLSDENEKRCFQWKGYEGSSNNDSYWTSDDTIESTHDELTMMKWNRSDIRWLSHYIFS